MCSVIGVDLFNVTKQDLDLVKNIFIESKIRGMHATGVTFLFQNQLITKIEPVSADKFSYINQLENFVDCGSIKLIGHCRYSTSDLLYNQPLYNDEVSIVHNGVISQEPSETWETLYGIKTATKNDSELLLHTISKNPIKYWEDSSISAIELHKDGKMVGYRNGKRPLYLTKLPNGLIYTSTFDIMTRASNHKYKPDFINYDGKDFQWKPF